jgi:catechol 2,3-dioxygenase-like lactoylglutathione lyase family enzyme
MDQRISLVTLGVTDLARARSFYEARGIELAHNVRSPEEVAHNPDWTLESDGAVRI